MSKDPLPHIGVPFQLPSKKGTMQQEVVIFRGSLLNERKRGYMQMLYDSDSFVVVHLNANEPDSVEPKARLVRHGFEIVDKRTNKEVYLDGSWAEAFQRQIYAWQLNTPTQEEVEEILDGYAELAQNPLNMH
jgi:hypothetical protein